MIRLCRYNQENVIKQVRQGKLDAVALSTSNLIDDIILAMSDKKRSAADSCGLSVTGTAKYYMMISIGGAYSCIQMT